MRKTKEEALTTKESIINAALYIFLDKGFSQTSVEDIVKSLGLTRGAFYWHFRDKDDLFRNIIHKEHSQRIEVLNSILAEDADEIVRVEKVMTNMISCFYDNERYRSFIKLRWFRIESDPEKYTMPATLQMNQLITSHLQETIRMAKEKGEIRQELDPQEVTFHLLALSNGIYRLFFVGLEFYQKKENSIKLITDYIRLMKT